MLIKPTKKWRCPNGLDDIVIPYTYYRLVESYRDADGRTKQRTVLGLGELEELPEESDRKELACLLTEMIKEGTCSISERPLVYDTALRLYGKYLEKKAEARRREDALAAEARAKAKSDDGTKAHLHLAILAYWVVSTARYILKQKGINVRWSEILRITSAQQRVTMAGNTADGKNVRIRKSTEPEEKLASIQSALGATLELGS